MTVGLLLTGAYIIHFKIGFSSAVLGVLALLAAIVSLVLFFGVRDRVKGFSGPERITLGGIGVLGVLAVLGFTGVLPSYAVGTADQWFLGVSPEGFGSIGMAVSFAVSIAASLATAPPPREVQDMVEEIRIPSSRAHVHHDGVQAPAE